MTRAAAIACLVLALHGLLGIRSLAQDQSDDPYAIGIALQWREGCPMLVRGVSAKSPAEAAGIAAGDHLLAIDGTETARLNGIQAATLMRSDRATSVVLKLSRAGKPYSVAVKREKLKAQLARDGKKMVSGIIVPEDTSAAEIKRMAQFDGSRLEARVFPSHYPTDPETYYGGFEVFVLRNPDEVIVGGIENGPASRAGVHWGDRILSVNGVDPRGKSVAQLEQLFSRSQAEPTRLRTERTGEIRTREFKLARTADLLAENSLRLEHGQLVPAGLASADVPCFTEKP